MDRMESLVGEHHAAVYRYAYRLTGSPHDAEDLTQQTFLAAQRKLDQLREPGHARAWLYTILRNTWLKELGRRVPVCVTRLDLEFDDLPAAEPVAVEVDAERLQMVMDELPRDFKLVLLMYYFEGSSYRDIAAELSLPIGTVMSRLSRAKAYLRRRLAPAEMQIAAAAMRRPEPISRPGRPLRIRKG